MRMNRIAALTLSAGMVTLAACSDSPTAPTAKVKQVGLGGQSFAVNNVFNGPAPVAAPGLVVVCKIGNIGGSFTFTSTPEGPEPDPESALADNQTIQNGKCLEVATDN